MRTNIPSRSETKTYTGDARRWPDGLYTVSLETLTPKIQVRNGRVFVIGESSMVQMYNMSMCNFFAEYYRIPGYTGGISAIEFEREGESE